MNPGKKNRSIGKIHGKMSQENVTVKYHRNNVNENRQRERVTGLWSGVVCLRGICLHFINEL